MTEPTSGSYHEHAGLIHYGAFQYGNYNGQGTPDGTYHVWEGQQYLGEYTGTQLSIIQQLSKHHEKTNE